MIDRHDSSIVLISSIHARLISAGMFPYAVAKAAIEGMTRSLAIDYGPPGVRVNAVAPGWTRTRLVDEWLSAQDDPATGMSAVNHADPLRFTAESENVAEVAVFLAS